MATNPLEVDDVRNRIAVALHRALCPVALLVLCLALPGTGRRRKAAREPRRTIVTSGNVKDQSHLVAHLVTPRSPYSTDRAPLDGAASPLSRPYLPEHLDVRPSEVAAVSRTASVRPHWAARERAVRLRRRAVAVLAADFRISLDTCDIHSVLDGVRSR